MMSKSKIELVWARKFRELCKKHGSQNLALVYDEYGIYCRKMEGEINKKWNDKRRAWE